MKKFFASMLFAIIVFSLIVVQVSAYSMGGTKIYDSTGNEVGSAHMWNEPNAWSNEMYTLGGSLESDTSSTLTVVLTPRGINLATGETDVLITTSPLSVSETKSVYHRYDINPNAYYPTLARATFIVNGTYSKTYQYSYGWNWG